MNSVLRFRLLLPLSLAALLGTSPTRLYAAEDPLLVTLQSVKTAVQAKRLDDAATALRSLAELIAAPEREAARPKILPALHFYSALVFWERRDETHAKESLLEFFRLQPDATIDPGAYSKSFRIFFAAEKTEAARGPLAATPAGAPGETLAGGVLPPYATRDVDLAAVPANTGATDWNESPAQFLLSDDEKKRWKSLADDDARREFINEFWRRLDPVAATPENEFQIEFYRRAQYADANFSTEKTRGSLSDRGMVFLVLGPPSYVGRAGIRSSQDVMNVLRTTEVSLVPSRTGGAALIRIPSERSIVSPGGNSGEAETWYYRRDLIPKGLPFNELQFQFITQRGYGSAVLQKEARQLMAIQRAARLLRNESHPN